MKWIYAAALMLPLSGCLSDERKEVSAAEFGDAWPLTVDRGTVDCWNDGSRTVSVTGGTYALNGPATAKGYPRIDPIWRDDPRYPDMGMKVSIQPLIERAGQFCP